MGNNIIRYMHLAGEVWIYLDNHEVRKATGPEIARIVDADPEFGLHFTSQNDPTVPMVREKVISLDGLDTPN